MRFFENYLFSKCRDEKGIRGSWGKLIKIAQHAEIQLSEIEISIKIQAIRATVGTRVGGREGGRKEKKGRKKNVKE